MWNYFGISGVSCAIVGDCCYIAVKLPGCDIIIMVLLWDCFGIAVILPCDSCDCGGIADVLLGCWCGVPLGLVEFPVPLLGIAVHCYDIAMAVLYEFCGIAGELLGDYCDTTMALLWECFATNKWYRCNITAGFWWYCSPNAGIAVVARLVWESVVEVVGTFH